MHKVLCIGSASVDIKAFSYQEDIHNAYRRGSIDLVPGGVARGMAINLKQLGFETAIATVVGADIFGEFLKRGLEQAGVDMGLMRTSLINKTALFSVMGAQGSSASCVYSNDVLSEITVDSDFITYINTHQIDALVIDSNISTAAMENLYRLKAENEKLFIFQNATSPDIARKSLPHAPLVDLFGANEFEAEAILGYPIEPNAATAEAFRRLGYRNAIITFGEEGVLVFIGNKTWIEKPYKPPVVVDTVGAGDAFAAGFLFGYLNGKPEKQCIRYGLSCARETIATRDTVCGFLTADFLESGEGAD